MDLLIHQYDDTVELSIPKRSLTIEEINLAKIIFGSTIRYNDIKVYKVAYFPNQEENTIVSPNGNLYPAKKVYRENYALEDDIMKHLFIHEMAYVW